MEDALRRTGVEPARRAVPHLPTVPIDSRCTWCYSRHVEALAETGARLHFLIMNRPRQLAFALPPCVADDLPAQTGKRRQKGVPVAQKRCLACDGRLTDNWHQKDLFEVAAPSAEISPGHACRCQELGLMGLVDRQNEGDKRIKERRRRERRSRHVSRRDRNRRVADRRVSTLRVGMIARAG